MQMDAQEAPESDASVEFTRTAEKCHNHCQVFSGIKRKEAYEEQRLRERKRRNGKKNLRSDLKHST